MPLTSPSFDTLRNFFLIPCGLRIQITHNQMNPQGKQTIQIKIASRFPKNNGYTHLVLQTNKKITEKVIQVERLLIGIRSCGIREFQEVIRCRGCKGMDTDPAHVNCRDSAQYPVKEDPTKHQCVACLRTGTIGYKNSALSYKYFTYIN